MLTLFLQSKSDPLTSRFKSIFKLLNPNSRPKFIANLSFWDFYNLSFSINRNFVKAIENTYDADIVAADLPRSIGAINDWAREETFGMIPSILKEGDLDEDASMVLLNALAFDALWAQQPSDESCFEDRFNGTDESTQNVKYMWAEANGYIKGKNEVGIVKNYKGGNYAFVALLPDQSIAIDDYMASLTGEKFLKLYDERKESAYNVEINTKIPHFSFDCSIEMEDVLKNMGMPIAFDSSAADFDAMGHSELGNIYISRVIQKTHIDLDNSGTRAAAVTAVIMEPESAAPGNIKYYRVELDRPFIYAIIDTQTGLPIFLGACDNIK